MKFTLLNKLLIQQNRRIMKKKLFQYFVLLHKYEHKEMNGSPTKVYLDTEMIIQPAFMMGRTKDEVAFKVTRMIKDEHASSPEDVEINVQDF